MFIILTSTTILFDKYIEAIPVFGTSSSYIRVFYYNYVSMISMKYITRKVILF